MTKRLLHNAQVIDPEAGTVSRGDIRIENGMITQVSQPPLSANPNEHAVDCHGKYLAPGIIDIGVKVCEPGERHKESFKSAGLAAAAGGITTMVTRPDTTPAIYSPETLEFIARRANQATPVNVMPMAALTKGRNGREMSEVGFLVGGGAIAFTDFDYVVSNPWGFAHALSYACALSAVVIAPPQETTLSNGAAATSGEFASLRGQPAD